MQIQTAQAEKPRVGGRVEERMNEWLPRRADFPTSRLPGAEAEPGADDREGRRLTQRVTSAKA